MIDTTTGSVLGQVERERAYSTVHEGAVYLHLGEAYRVAELDLAARQALVSPFTGDLYTQPKKDTTTAIEEPLRDEHVAGVELHWGRVTVTEQVIAYQVKQVSTQATLDLVALDLPETTFETEAVWFSPPDELLEGIDKMPKLLGALHAAEHALIALLPLWAMCDRWDIGGLSTNIHFQTARPTIFVYDGHPGGVGITERGFEAFEGWAADTARMIAGCPCEHGCPSCVQSPKCGNLNDMLDKARRAAQRCSRRCWPRIARPGSYGFSTSVSAGAFSSSHARSFAVNPPWAVAGAMIRSKCSASQSRRSACVQRAALLEAGVDRNSGPDRRRARPPPATASRPRPPRRAASPPGSAAARSGCTAGRAWRSRRGRPGSRRRAPSGRACRP